MFKKTPSVFLTYSNSDKDKVNEIIEALDRRSVNYWAHNKLKPGEDWAEAADKAIQRASVIVLFVSQSFLDSKFCMYEAGNAISMSKINSAAVLAVLLKDEEPPKIFSRLPLIDSRVKTAEDVAGEILRILKSHGGKARP